MLCIYIGSATQSPYRSVGLSGSRVDVVQWRHLSSGGIKYFKKVPVENIKVKALDL
jgi:hypothetical protein